MVFLALGIGHAQDQHVFGQPARATGGAFCGCTAHGGGDAQRKTFLAQQRVAAVTGAVGPDFAGLWVVDDVFGRVARPFHIGLARLQRRAGGVHAGHEIAIHTQHVVHGLAHAGHDALVHGHIGAVGQFDPDVGDV